MEMGHWKESSHLREHPRLDPEACTGPPQTSNCCKRQKTMQTTEPLAPNGKPTVCCCEGCVRQVPTPRPAPRTPLPPAPPGNSRWAPTSEQTPEIEERTGEGRDQRAETSGGAAPDGAARSTGSGPRSQGGTLRLTQASAGFRRSASAPGGLPEAAHQAAWADSADACHPVIQ